MLVSPAQAQTPTQSTVQQVISMHANVEAQLAEQLDQARAKITADEAEIKRLKDKYEPAKAPEPKK